MESTLKELLKEKSKQNISKPIIAGQSYIPVTGKVIEEDDILSGVEAALDGWLTAGRFANQFEYEFAQYFWCA